MNQADAPHDQTDDGPLEPEDEAYGERFSVTIPKLDTPLRIDRYLATVTEINASRSQIQRALKAGRVTVNGKTVAANYKLTGAEEVEVVLERPEPQDLVAEDIPLDVRFEDEYLLVVNKPSGMVTHPAVGAQSGTLVHALLGRETELSDLYGRERAGIVHRLDKLTTGLLVVAKTIEIHRALQEQLQARELKRTYLALICGHLKKESGEINLPIGRSLKDRKKMAVTNVAAREAITQYELLERFKSYDYVQVELQTGRTHQIRVHFAHLGHPVFGDTDYGGRDRWHKGLFGPERQFGEGLLRDFSRQALHAWRLSFTHPVTGEFQQVEAELPEDMATLIQRVREHG